MLNSVNYLFIYIKIEISSDDPVQIQPANQENAVTDQYTEPTIGIFTVSFEKPKKKHLGKVHIISLQDTPGHLIFLTLENLIFTDSPFHP